MNLKATMRLLYNLIPWKQQLFSVLRHLPLPPGLTKHLHFVGTFTVNVHEKKFQMQHYGYQLENEIFWNGIFGGWERTSLKIWDVLARQSHYIFDVGANTGLYALLAKTVNPPAEVFAFEPVARVYERMLKNFALNGYAIRSEKVRIV